MFIGLLEKLGNFCRNLWNYRTILWCQKDWDYDYLLKLEQFKINLMIKEFTENSYKNHSNDIKWLSICIKLIDIILKEDDYLIENNKTSEFILAKYVNTNNAARFKYANLATKSTDSLLRILGLRLLRQYKALYLYNKIRYNYMFEWWD